MNKAALLAGINRVTLHRWIERGEKAKSGKYRKFADDVERAKARGQQKLIDHIRDTGSLGLFQEETRVVESDKGTTTTKIVKRVVDWRASAWLLERMNPEDWGAKDNTAQGGEDDNSEIQSNLEEAARRMNEKGSGE